MKNSSLVTLSCVNSEEEAASKTQNKNLNIIDLLVIYLNSAFILISAGK